MEEFRERVLVVVLRATIAFAHALFNAIHPAHYDSKSTKSILLFARALTCAYRRPGRWVKALDRTFYGLIARVAQSAQAARRDDGRRRWPAFR